MILFLLHILPFSHSQWRFRNQHTPNLYWDCWGALCLDNWSSSLRCCFLYCIIITFKGVRTCQLITLLASFWLKVPFTFLLKYKKNTDGKFGIVYFCENLPVSENSSKFSLRFCITCWKYLTLSIILYLLLVAVYLCFSITFTPFKLVRYFYSLLLFSGWTSCIRTMCNNTKNSV